MLSELVRKNIREVRRRKGYTLDEAARRANIEKRTLQRIESGEKKAIDTDTIEQIAAGWEIDYGQLLPTAESSCMQPATNDSGQVMLHENGSSHAIPDELRAILQQQSDCNSATLTALTALVRELQGMIAALGKRPESSVGNP